MIIFFYSCSSTNQLILMDCLPSYNDSLKTNLISYSYDPSTKSSELIGKVMDNFTNELLIGANIILLPCNKGAATDKYGTYNFRLIVSECDSILVRYVGYIDKTISIRKLIAEYISKKNFNNK